MDKIENKTTIKDILLYCAIILGLIYTIIQISEAFEKHSFSSFNKSFVTICIIIFLIILFKTWKKIFNFIKTTHTFLKNLKYISRLEEVEPFKGEARLKNDKK